jgi:hypothetical protein
MRHQEHGKPTLAGNGENNLDIPCRRSILESSSGKQLVSSERQYLQLTGGSMVDSPPQLVKHIE